MLSAFCFLLSVACGGGSSGHLAGQSGLPVGMDPESLKLPRLERPEKFTFRDSNSFPLHWNPHGRFDTNIQVTTHRDFTSLRFSNIYSPNVPGEPFDLMYFAATDSRDITAEFQDKAKFGLPPDAQSGLVYAVDLRQDLRWDDGTPIDAHSYVRSMELLLDPKMMNPAAAGWADEFVGARAFWEGRSGWDQVGVFANGDYEIIFVLVNWRNLFDFRNDIHGEWLVHEGMYMAGMSRQGDLMVTNYNTSIETSRFAGPYKIVVAELERQLVLERNPMWFGWTDPAFDNFYMMTDIVIDVIPQVSTSMMLFNQGLLDRMILGADYFEAYRFSDHIVQRETTNLGRFVYNTDLDALAKLERDMGDGFNRRVLSLKNFRKGLSFAIDRFRYTQQGTPGHMPSVVLLENYFYDFSNNPDSRFRENEHAMKAVVDFYEVKYGSDTPFPTVQEAYASITGYDLNRARQLLQAAYEEAVANGIYTPGQKINIQHVVSSTALTPAHMRQNDLLREMFAQAAVGTGFEGLIDITFLGNFPQSHEALIGGRLEARSAGWGGSIFSPIGLMGVYTNTVSMNGLQNINESAGWDPSTDTLSMTYDWYGTGEETTKTKTFQDWHMSISGTGEFVADEFLDTRVFILANLEVGVLNTFQAIPISVEVQNILVSQKINFVPGYYHPMFDDLPGPRSQIHFNYTDDAWTKFVASQGGTLNYE